MTTLHDLIDSTRAGKLWDPSFKHSLPSTHKAQCSWLIREAMSAVCFDVGDTFGVPQLKIIPELFRLPYPVTWIEGKSIDGIVAVLATETGERQHNLAFLEKRLGLAWQWVGVAEVAVKDDDVIITDVRAVPETPGSHSHMGHVTKSVVGCFLMALNCTNTIREEHPAPKFMNSQRTKKGKQPLFSYWTLRLPGNSASGNAGGTHASPRVHLRRGHVRQYAPEKYTWVEACVVGKKEAGMVDKDYAVDTNAMAERGAVTVDAIR